MRTPFTLVTAALVASLTLAACGSDDSAANNSTAPETTIDTTAPPVGHRLTGQITIQGADELSHIADRSTVVITLSDVSLQDAAAVTIATQTVENVSTLPVTYELTWSDDLQPGRDYAVSATITDGDGETQYWTDTNFSVAPGDTTVDFFVVAA